VPPLHFLIGESLLHSETLTPPGVCYPAVRIEGCLSFIFMLGRMDGEGGGGRVGSKMSIASQ
jgi:hypothetical protein